MIKVLFPPKLSQKFYKVARSAFPNEEYAILLGKKTPEGFQIDHLYFPSERLNDLSPDYVNVQPNWFETAQEMAGMLKLEVLGDIHSHCYEEIDSHAGTDPSEADWEYAEQKRILSGGKYRLMGIVRVLKKGDKLSCRTRFWPAVDLPVIVNEH